MEGKKTKPRALLVFGVPCSGKTTFAKKFSEKFGLSYYDFDEIKNEHDFSNGEILIILDLIARSRQTLVIEGNLSTEKERKVIRNTLLNAGYDVSLIWIQTDMSTIRMRMKNKYKSVKKAKELYDKVIESMEAPSELERPIILSGKHTFETQSKHVLAGLADVNKR